MMEFKIHFIASKYLKWDISLFARNFDTMRGIAQMTCKSCKEMIFLP